MRITDIHTHAFPDDLAERVMTKLSGTHINGMVTAYTDGRVSGLLSSMDRAGIDRSVVCSIATKPSQFDTILAWSKTIASERIIPLPSVHPRDPKAVEQLDRIQAEGFVGIKMHPYYQDYRVDEEAMLPLYERMEALGLILVSHTGFDIEFPLERKADSSRILEVVRRFPALKFVSTHLGAWRDWEDVRDKLMGKPVYMEISYTLGEAPTELAREILTHHPPEYLLFGTDSPWQDQAETIRRLNALDLGKTLEDAILGGNAERLLG